MEKEKGILQFGTMGEKRGDEERRNRKLMEFALPVDDKLADILKDEQKEKKEAESVKLMTGIDYRNTSLHYDRGITLDKQFARQEQKSSNFPVHMQRQAGRLACNELTYKTLMLNNYPNRPFIDQVSSFNTRKDFRVDPKKTKVLSVPPSSQGKSMKKKNLTFN